MFRVNKLLSILKEIRPEHNFSESKDFIYDGLLDSFDIVTLVAKLEKYYKISIDGDEVRYENFKNLKNLERFIRRYKNSDES